MGCDYMREREREREENREEKRERGEKIWKKKLILFSEYFDQKKKKKKEKKSRRRTNDPLSTGIVTWTSSSTNHLHDILWWQFNMSTFRWIIHLSACKRERRRQVKTNVSESTKAQQQPLTISKSTPKHSPLITTVCAGRFTPHASVAVEHKTFNRRSRNKRSTRSRSMRVIPAWWMPIPHGMTYF